MKKNLYSSKHLKEQDIGKTSRYKKNGETVTWRELVAKWCRRTVTLLLLIGVLLLAVGMARFAWKSPYFVVEKIVFESTPHCDRESLLREIGLNRELHLMKISSELINKRVSQNPWIQSVKVIKRYPSVLIINVQERKPAMLIVGEQTLGIDTEGVLLPEIDIKQAVNIPLLNISGNINIKEHHKLKGNDISNAVYVLDWIKKNKPDLMAQISEIDISNPRNTKLITQPDGTEISLGNINFDKRLEMMCRLLEQNEPFDYIDLRYDEDSLITHPRKTGIKKPEVYGTVTTPST